MFMHSRKVLLLAVCTYTVRLVTHSLSVAAKYADEQMDLYMKGVERRADFIAEASFAIDALIEGVDE